MSTKVRTTSTRSTLDDETAATRRVKFFTAFLLSSPPKYAGSSSTHDHHDVTLEAVEWVRKVKKCLNVIAVPEDLRVEFAAYTLTGSADCWWHFMKRTRHGVESMIWQEFEELFMQKYFPPFAETAKLSEFVDLNQGNMTIAEFEAKFIQLAHHLPDLVKLDSDARQWFLRKLRPDIARGVACDLSSDDEEESTYNKAVAGALFLERMNGLRDKASDGTSGGGRKIKGAKRTGPRADNISCYNCGKPGHIRSNCPLIIPTYSAS